jgi:hypothetical protein
VFRGRELDLRPKSKLPVPSDEHIVVHLPGSNFGSMDLGEVFSAIEGEDESIVGVNRSHEKLIELHAVVTVRDNVIEGLPGRANPMLRLLIGTKAKDAAYVPAIRTINAPGIEARFLIVNCHKGTPLY